MSRIQTNKTSMRHGWKLICKPYPNIAMPNKIKIRHEIFHALINKSNPRIILQNYKHGERSPNIVRALGKHATQQYHTRQHMKFSRPDFWGKNS